MQNRDNWQRCLLNANETILTAIETLDKTGLGIVLVVDEHRHLIGTITDGDIRRALIKKQGIEAQLHTCMNQHPTTMQDTESRRQILEIMQDKQFYHMPLLNKHQQVVGLETLQHLLKRHYYDNPVFLMAGGFGKRLRPLTDTTPKPLLKIGDKPILQTILEQFIEAGFYNFYISTHYFAEQIQAHFGDGCLWGVNITYVHEEKPLGTAGALSLLPKEQIKKPILMMNGDILTKVDLVQLLAFHQRHKSIATMCVREYDYQIPYGVISAKPNSYYMSEITEKPSHKMFVNAGIYVLDPALLTQVNADCAIDMPTLLQNQINQNELISLFPVHEYWLDIGQIKQFETAIQDYPLIFEKNKAIF